MRVSATRILPLAAHTVLGGWWPVLWIGSLVKKHSPPMRFKHRVPAGVRMVASALDRITCKKAQPSNALQASRAGGCAVCRGVFESARLLAGPACVCKQAAAALTGQTTHHWLRPIGNVIFTISVKQ